MALNRHRYDIIIFTLFRDDNAYSSVSLSIGKEFAKQNRVFYINHPYSLKDIAQNRDNQKVQERLGDMVRFKVRYETIPEIPNLTVVVTPPTLPINWMSPGVMYDSFYKINNRAVASTLKQVIQDYDIKNYIYYNCFNPFFLNSMPFSLPVQPEVNVYQCIDDLDHDAYTARHGVRLERLSVKNSDLTLVTATQLQKKYIGIKPETYIMNNAVDITIFKEVMFKTFEKPAEIAHVKTKIIGFTGNLDHLRINYGLFKKIALQHTDKTLVIVGPINCKEFYDIGLDKMPNVITTGSKKIYELPQYLQYFDVAIIPFAINDVTKSIYPLKINEYLAAGRAVVATNFSEDIRSFKDSIYIGKDESEFIQLIDVAIAENNEDLKQKRYKVGASNTWADRVEEFWKIIDRHLMMKKRTPELTY
jgi:teichuronic acid biosynthesis glycosyltransferase TuaH